MKIKTLLIVSLLFLSINIFATGVSFEENREDAVNDLKTFTVETSVLKLEEDSSTSIPTIKQYWLNSENNSINELIDFAININDIGTGSNSIYYKWAKDSNNNIVLQNGTSSDYNLKINYSNYTNTSQSITTNNTTISDKFFYNSPTGTILNYATDTKINGIFANNHNSQYDQFYNGGNIINYKYKINSIDGIFINNYENGSIRAFGGAIFNTENSIGNRSYIESVTGDFVGNYTVSSGNDSNVLSGGGAIYNYTTIVTINSNFILNHSNGVRSSGGAISNCDIDTRNMAYITNIKGDFILNYVYATGSSSGGNGGAIYNNGYITNIDGTFINNSVKSVSYTGNGGAIFNVHDIQNITGNFIENYIDSRSNAYGGAIYNKNSLTGEYCINNIIANFIGNYAKSSNGAAYGGAIYNKHIINNITGIFINNSAMGITAYGGAIANEGQMTIVDAKFINNTATSYGGAIYNSKDLNLIANTTDIEFKNNNIKGISNAVYDSSGTINLLANENKNIIFNDRIKSQDNKSILNINSSTSTLNAIGKIILNEDMSDFLGTVNLYNGEIELQAKTNGNNINTNKLFSGNINLSSGTFNILNNSIDNIIISTLTTTSNVNLQIDVDLRDNKSDNFTITNNITGEINLEAINILNTLNDSGYITLFNNEKSPTINILTNGYYNGYEYVFTNSLKEGVIDYEKTGIERTFKDVINLETYVRSYSLSKDEIVTENLENLGGHQLTIFGNGYYVKSSNNFEGIYVAKDKTLNIENVNNWSGFNNTYGAIKNEGTLNISGTNFSNNEGHDIINNGNLVLTDVSSSFEKGIIGTGTTTINGVSINLANAVIEQNKIEIENNGSLKTKAQNIVGKIENNSNLILIEGTNNNYIFGSGITTIDGSVINSSTIVNNIKINSSKQLTTSATNINGQIENNGNLVFIGGNNNNQIIGTGTTIIDGTVTNDSSITNFVTINQNKQLTTSATNIKKSIQNNGKLIFNDGSNNNQITGTGTTIIDGEVINNSTVINKVKINYVKKLTTNASNINGQIENNGTLILNGGINNNIITGNIIIGMGSIQIYDDVINQANITQDNLEILANKKLTNKSTITINELLTINSNAKIINSGKLVINSGINNGNIEKISNSSLITISENFTNNGTINSSLAIEQSGTVKSNATNIDGQIENNGSLVLNAGENKNYILGIGTTTIDGSIINSSTIANNIKINSSKQLTTSATNINGQIENNGNLIFNGGTNNNIVTGTGLTQIYDNVTNQANITQNNLEILANKQLTNSSTITIKELLTINNNAKVINNGKLLISSGTNNGSIDQTTNTSITIIYGNFVNNGTIKQKELNIAETGKIINNNNIIAKIINSGILILNSGTENNNEIMGNGKLYINCNLINNNVINQKEIEINSNINMASSLDNTEQKLNEFINNSEISAEKLKLKATMLKLTENGILKVNNFYSEQNSAMDLANNKIQQHNFKTISVTDNLNLSVDVDLINKQMDTITADNYDGTGKININEINILTDTKQEKISITFTTSTVLKGNITSVNTANSRVFKYDVEYNKNLGNLIFSLTKDINFTVIESQVANSVGGFVTQTTIFNQAFASMENIRSRILQVKNEIPVDSPIYASRANTIFFQKTGRIESGLWLRPFYSQETINFDNLSVDNTLTGTLAGLDLATGENSLVSLYLGYAGSEQKYENIKVSQTGYILGATGMLLKEQWYAGVTANINFNKAESQSSYGTDNFDMNMYSVGAKAGYNFDLSDKWKLEPNLMLMYGNVNSQEYQTKQGAKVEGQSVANIIFEPQIKAKLNLENGWQPYGLIGYVVNAGDKVTTKVEEVEFDGQKIGNYVEFGAGVDKSFKNSPWSLYIQLMGRSGDRTGFDGNFGMKYSFLTAKEKRKIAKIKKIQEKRKAKQEYLKQRRKMETEE